MTAALHLCTIEDKASLLALVTAFHAETGTCADPAKLAAALDTLLAASPHGAAYLIGPKRAPVGYVAIGFGFSIEFGGIDGFIDELYIRPKVRGRGIAGEVLERLGPALAAAGVKALHLEMDRENETAQRLYARSRFELRSRYSLMSKHLT